MKPVAIIMKMGHEACFYSTKIGPGPYSMESPLLMQVTHVLYFILLLNTWASITAHDNFAEPDLESKQCKVWSYDGFTFPFTWCTGW